MMNIKTLIIIKMKKKIDKRSKEYRDSLKKDNKSKGLGDDIEKIMIKTGVKSLVKAIFGDDCGCDKRKEHLNKLFKYKTDCLEESEFNILKEILPNLKSSISNSDQVAILKIYNRVFSQNNKPTSCSRCWIRIIKDMNLLYSEYLKEMGEN